MYLYYYIDLLSELQAFFRKHLLELYNRLVFAFKGLRNILRSLSGVSEEFQLRILGSLDIKI